MAQPVRINSSAGEDLLFKSMDLSEEIGRLFNCRLELFSDKEDVDLEKLLGTDVTVEIDLPEDRGTRYVHGLVSEIAHTGRSGAYVTYSATLRPWFWFLSRAAGCRIFQQMTVPDIIKKVFADRGFSDYKASLKASYRKWEYCVQYRETDFNFLSRLMEQEGIYYFFEYEDGKHTLVLADALGAHKSLPEYAEIPYYPPSDNVVREEHVFEWALKKSVRTGKFSSTAFYFIEPKSTLDVSESIAASHPHAKYEFFDYPGEHYKKADGDRYAKVHMEELAAQHERVTGQTDALGLFPGGLFTLKKYPRGDQNREYLIVSTRHHLSIGGYEAATDGDELEYNCNFEAMPSAVPFRTERLTPKPVMQGPQTAIVVGKSGEEIDTDEYGRVKVQFKWDRDGKKDEKSSCWVRVAQVWAGGQWGGMAIPRIGQEVIVDFIEGDPDRPIVTGRVYNADNMPPYELPGNKTRSTIKSRSTKGAAADNFNEIRFEDKKGEEEFYVHAEKDHNLVVENNQTITVGDSKKDPGDRALAVHNDEGIKIGRDRSLQVGRDKRENVGRHKSIDVKGNHGEGVGGNMTITVAKSLTETVALNYAESVGAAMELTVGGALAETVGANRAQTIGNNSSSDVANNLTVKVGKNFAETVGENYTAEVTKDASMKVGGMFKNEITKEYSVNAKKLQFVAGDEITIKTGSAEITMKKNGDITIKGNKINIKGSGDVIVKGSQVKEN
jgi:type VI secretion system secreted protein VgrG